MVENNKKKDTSFKRRIAPRTFVKRPCLMWTDENPNNKVGGIILDLNMYGVKIRTTEIFPIGQELYIQMMHDEEHTQPLGVPIKATIVWSTNTNEQYIDYGMKRILDDIKKTDRRGKLFITPSKNPVNKPPDNFILKEKKQ